MIESYLVTSGELSFDSNPANKDESRRKHANQRNHSPEEVVSKKESDRVLVGKPRHRVKVLYRRRGPHQGGAGRPKGQVPTPGGMETKRTSLHAAQLRTEGKCVLADGLGY
jgi:hypothetical protein